MASARFARPRSFREGKAIHLSDGEAVREHFATIMSTYRGMGAAAWWPVEIEPHPLGDSASFTTVRWNATDERGNITRGYAYDVPLAREPRGLALPVVHQPLLTWQSCRTPHCRR